VKKAYIILAHKYPEQLHRLVKRLDDAHSAFFVHIDKNVEISQFKRLGEFGDAVHFVERVGSEWGSFGQVQSVLNGLKAVKESSTQFDIINLLSGQDYPIKSNAEIDSHFKASQYSVFIDYFPLPNFKKWKEDNGGMYRVNKYFFGLKRYKLFFSKSINFLATFIPFLRRKIPDGMKPYAGSQWWSIDMYALNYVLDYINKHPKYAAFHQYTFACDELFFQMILVNSIDERIQKSIENDNKRFMKWKTSDSSHPETLVTDDLPDISNSKALFARKFDLTKDGDIFDIIDKKCLFLKR